MHPCTTALGVEEGKGLCFVFFFSFLSKLVRTLKIHAYFKMITPCPVSVWGQVELQEALSSIKQNKFINLKFWTLLVLWICVKALELINHKRGEGWQGLLAVTGLQPVFWTDGRSRLVDTEIRKYFWASVGWQWSRMRMRWELVYIRRQTRLKSLLRPSSQNAR